MAATFTACTDDSDNPVSVSNTVTPEEYVEPTTDQMGVSVTTDLPAAVLGTFDDNSTGAALIRRLPSIQSDIDFDTRLVLLKGSDFQSGSPLSEDQMYLSVVAYMAGGYIAIERPTLRQLENFSNAFVEAAVELQADLFEENFDLNDEEAAAAARSTAHADRMKARTANVRSYATRAGVDVEDEVIAEMLILGPIDYFYQEPFNAETTITTQTQDGDGPVSEPVKETFKQERNSYRNGLMADAAAQWLNDAEMRLATTEAAARATTRADGNAAINSLMSASETFTFSGRIADRIYNNKKYTSYRILQTIRSWGVHNFSTNKDYYYVQQNISLDMGKKSDKDWIMYEYEGPGYWHSTSNFDYWNNWYGSFLSQYTTSMELTGKGDILMEAAIPTTDNGSTSTSVNIGQSSSHTETAGISWSGTFGISGGKPTATGTIGGSFSAGTTNGTSFALNTSRTHKDLTPVMNRDGNKVTWTYKGNLPKFRIEDRDGYYYYVHETVPEILVSTATLTNEICWSVANPEGRYTLNVTSYPQTAALMYHHAKKHSEVSKEGHYEYTTADIDNQFSHEFLQPNRSQQKWNMSITVDETMGTAIPGQGAALEKRIAEQYPSLFQKEFTVADKTAESLEMANAFISYAKGVFSEQYDVLQNMAKDQGIKKFTINWRRQGVNSKEGFTVLVEGYNNLQADGGMDDGTNKVANLFDSNYYTKWMVNHSETTPMEKWYVEFHAPNAISPKSYTMVTAADASENYIFNPCEWKLFGKKSKSDDWTLLATVNDRDNKGDGLPWANSSAKTKQFDVTPKDMQYFRLETVSWRWAAQLAEFYFN